MAQAEKEGEGEDGGEEDGEDGGEMYALACLKAL